MRIERLLQISIAALVSLSTLLLGMGERDLTLPVVAIIVSAGSLYLTDIKGWLQLNTTVTNIAGLLALAATVYDWDYFGAESQLLSMAHLLIYLQFVLLFRKKNLRNYWLLVLLSLLEVAVASALNMSIFFGLLLLIYMFAGLITLAVFSIYREYRRGLELWEAWLAPRLAGARVRRPPSRGRGRRGAELGLDRTSAEVELFDADLVVDVVLRPAARRQIHALANEQRPRAAHDRLLGNRHLGRARG